MLSLWFALDFFFLAEMEDLELDFFLDLGFYTLLLGKVIMVFCDLALPFCGLILIGCRTEVRGL